MSLASAMQTMAPATFDSMGGQVGDSLKSGTASQSPSLSSAIKTDVGRNEGMLAESKQFQLPNNFTLNALPSTAAPQGTFGEAAFRQRNGFGV